MSKFPPAKLKWLCSMVVVIPNRLISWFPGSSKYDGALILRQLKKKSGRSPVVLLPIVGLHAQSLVHGHWLIGEGRCEGPPGGVVHDGECHWCLKRGAKGEAFRAGFVDVVGKKCENLEGSVGIAGGETASSCISGVTRGMAALRRAPCSPPPV